MTDYTPTTRPRRRTVEISDDLRQEVLELSKYYGTRQIGRRVGCGRKLVRRILDEAGVEVNPVQPSKLEPFKEEIASRVAKKLNASRILREIRALGYSGGISILTDHVRALRMQLPVGPRKKKVKRRFETPAGREMQLDWSPYTLIIAGRPTDVKVLGCLMCYSRKLFLYISRSERQPLLLEGIARAFEYFGGCPLDVILDNMTTAVLGRIGPDRKILWTPKFMEFCRHYGVNPKPCAPRDPDRKGKKERSFRYLWEDCLLGVDFESWEALDAHVATWLDHTPGVGNLRIHGTTRQVPVEAFLAESDLLIRLPRERFPYYEDTVRVVDQDSTISVQGTHYTVPATLAGRTVAVHLFSRHFEVFDDHRRLAFSRNYVEDVDHGKLIIDPTHYASIPRQPRDAASRERFDDAFLLRYPSLQDLVDGLKRRMKSLAHIHIRALVRLADDYGPEAFLVAAERAQSFRRYSSRAIQRILEKTNPLPENEPLSPLGGAGPAIVGEIEPPSMDCFDHLDDDPPTEAGCIDPAEADDDKEDGDGA